MPAINISNELRIMAKRLDALADKIEAAPEGVAVDPAEIYTAMAWPYQTSNYLAALASGLGYTAPESKPD